MAGMNTGSDSVGGRFRDRKAPRVGKSFVRGCRFPVSDVSGPGYVGAGKRFLLLPAGSCRIVPEAVFYGGSPCCSGRSFFLMCLFGEDAAALLSLPDREVAAWGCVPASPAIKANRPSAIHFRKG